MGTARFNLLVPILEITQSGSHDTHRVGTVVHPLPDDDRVSASEFSLEDTNSLETFLNEKDLRLLVETWGSRP